ncbi:MAG: exodeoxyribonuclease VII large subunit, partial [Alphaproteobacteria bacterium]
MSISNQELTFSVSEISSSIKNLIEDNFAQVAIKGEISGFVHHQSGHMYMTLKDENSSIKATCWKFTIPKLDIMPEEGMEVIATGKITTYDKNSSYQLNISNIKPSGIGALLKQLEERKKKLSAEGLFDEEHKKPIPRMPNTIGVITSPTGAVIHDIMHR